MVYRRGSLFFFTRRLAKRRWAGLGGCGVCVAFAAHCLEPGDYVRVRAEARAEF